MDQFLIKKPLVTEKSTDLRSTDKYVFEVKPGATKPEIKKAIKAIYKVDPIKINVINKSAKRKNVGRFRGRQTGLKKAVVTLKTGQKIDIR